MKNEHVFPTALYADNKGEIYDAPGYQAVGRTGHDDARLDLADMIPLPEGADLVFLPGASALAARNGQIGPIATPLLAIAALLPVGYTRTHLPAYVLSPGAQRLPLYGYTAVACHKQELYVAAIKSDDTAKWHPCRYNTPGLAKKIARVRQDLPGNRLVEQLAYCSQEWHCATAQNLFYRRWEAGVPTSPACNAHCLGCISLQPAECCPAPQSRIEFIPSVEEVAAIGRYHLAGASEPIISFGQGCEGEPSLAASTIAAAIREIRTRTSRGFININTNAGYTAGVQGIADAGLESMRVSMISARPEIYDAYYRPDYSLDAVAASIAYAKAKGVYISINMLLLPGLNDRSEEIAAWCDFIDAAGVDMVQFRNLNIDPELVWQAIPLASGQTLGVKSFISQLRQRFPTLAIGNFSRYCPR